MSQFKIGSQETDAVRNVLNEERFAAVVKREYIYKNATPFGKFLMKLTEAFGIEYLPSVKTLQNVNFEKEIHDILVSFVKGDASLTGCKMQMFENWVELNIDRQDKANPKLVFIDSKHREYEISRNEIMLQVFEPMVRADEQPNKDNFISEIIISGTNKDFNPSNFNRLFIEDGLRKGISEEMYVSITKNNEHTDINHNLRDVPVNELTQIEIQQLVIQNEVEYQESLNKDKAFHQLIKEPNDRYYKRVGMLEGSDDRISKVEKFKVEYLEEVEKNLDLESGAPETAIVEHLLSQGSLFYNAGLNVFLQTTDGKLLAPNYKLNDDYVLKLGDLNKVAPKDALIWKAFHNLMTRPTISERNIEITKGSEKAIAVVSNVSDRIEAALIYNEESRALEIGSIFVKGKAVFSLQENGEKYSSQETYAFSRIYDNDEFFDR